MLNQNIWRKMNRGPQVVTLKDAALISAFTGLQSGDRVVDAGTGSGFLAVYLASIVAPTGSVTSYERRSEFAEVSRKNIERAELKGVVKVKEKDVFKGIEEKEVDLITLDLAEPEKVLGSAKEALKPNGFLVAYLPHTEQVKALVLEAEKKKFLHVSTFESSIRNWLVREYGCRPDNMGMVFTGFIVTLKRVSEEEFDSDQKKRSETKKGRRAKKLKQRLGN